MVRSKPFPACIRMRSLLAVLAVGLAFALPSRADDPTRDKKIADLEQQLKDLSKRLEDLRRAEASPGAARPEGGIPAAWVNTLHWRCIGPAAMGGRIVAFSVFEADPSTYWVATASGGLLKTVNNGVTFEHQFDREATVSVGDVCVAPSDKNVVWVGTGENNPRNSVSYGDGVYKSTDGGRTWKNVGLKKSFQIGRVLVHPKNPNIVYVGALGRLYGPNEERGLYKTTDGGQTWNKVLSIDDKTGVIDIQMHPSDPETLLVAAWERRRDGYDTHNGEPPVVDGYDHYDPVTKWGAGGGIFKTTDGGRTFHKLTQGLPTSPTGRIGLEYYRKNPNIVFAIIDCQKIAMGNPPTRAVLGVEGENAAGGAKITKVVADSAAAKAGLQVGDVVKAVNKVPVGDFGQLSNHVNSRAGGDKIDVQVVRGQETREVAVTLDGKPLPPEQIANKTRPWSFWYGGQRENIQDKQGPNGFEYGGLYRSADGGETWTRINSVNPRPMYFSKVKVDPTDENFVYVLGILLYRSRDGGKTFTADGGRTVHPDQHALWIDPRDGRHMLVGCDGGFYATYDRMDHWDFLNHKAIGQFYHVALDSRRPYRVYGGLQDNGSWGGPSHALHGEGPLNEDWVAVGGGDGFVCRVDPTDPDLVYFEFQDGNVLRRHLRKNEWAGLKPPDPRGQAPYRFNWNTPFLLSVHNPQIFYSGGNFVFRSLSRGKGLKVISPDITRTGRGSATALAESPLNADVLYAGTDDGNLWVTRDGGTKWNNVRDKVGLPGPRWVASIEPSRYVEGRAYVAFDAHRSDDDEPYLYVTEDFGQSWSPLRGNLPTGSTRVLREDLENEDVLYAGTEFAVWASIDRGRVWTRINANLPTVAVHELAQHPSAGEMVAATHGRSLWILDVSALRQMKPATVREPVHFFRPLPAVHWRSEPSRGSMYGNGDRRFAGENPPGGAQLYYSLAQKVGKASFKIQDYSGKTLRELGAPTDPGLHRVAWDLIAPREPPVPPGRSGGFPARLRVFGVAAGAPLLASKLEERRDPIPLPVAPGMYRVVLVVDGAEFAQGLKVDPDPEIGTPSWTFEEGDKAKERDKE